MYPESIVSPMKAELTAVGFEDLTSPDAVNAAINSPGTTLVVVNSVCGCALGKMQAMKQSARSAPRKETR